MISTTRNMALMFMALAVVSSGGMFALGQELGTTDATPIRETSGMFGHVTATVADKNTGDVKQYMQSDNAILHAGKVALIDEIFGTDLSTYDTGAATDYSFIGLGTTNASAVAETDGGNAFFAEEDDCVRQDTTATPGTTNGITDNAGNRILNLQVVFDATAQATCVGTFDRAGLLNSVTFTAGDVMAATEFAAPVTLADTDTLTVDWDITFE